MLTANDAKVIDLASKVFAPLASLPSPFWEHRADVQIQSNAITVDFDGHLTTHPRDHRDEVLVGAFHATQDVFSRFFATDPRSWACYGSAVRFADKILLLIGPTGIGKTVLSLHLAARGADICGDESFVIEHGCGRVEAVPRGLLLREPALPLLPNEQMRSACKASKRYFTREGRKLWYALDPAAFTGRKVCPVATRPDMLVVIDAVRTDAPSLERMSDACGTLELSRSMYRRIANLDELARLRGAVNDTRSYRLKLGDPSTAAGLIIEAIAGFT